MATSADSADLLLALEGRYPYKLLSAALRQRLGPREYVSQTLQYSILRSHAYYRLPDFVKAIIGEKEYYQEMISYSAERMQLYPYTHQQSLLLYTAETPLSYYRSILATMLKTEQSYDRLPNFTAVDVLRLLGIGRNEYLGLTKEVRSSLRWHVNRSFVSEHLPQRLLPSVVLAPFWTVVAVPLPVETVRQRCQGDASALYRMLITKGAAATAGGFGGSALPRSVTGALGVSADYFAREVYYACELPSDALHTLYRSGLVCASFSVGVEDTFTVPPLEQFVMNRTSDDPQEVLLYRILSTLDDHTPLQLLAQLLMLDEADICSAARLLLHLQLIQPRNARVPDVVVSGSAVIHSSWAASMNVALREAAQRQQELDHEHEQQEGGTSSEAALNTSPGKRVDDHEDLSDVLSVAHPSPTTPTTAPAFSTAGLRSGSSTTAAGGHPRKRIALLYDATLTGFLMMTNLSVNPTFKHHAVTLFEVGKMPNEVVTQFLTLLEEVDVSSASDFGGEAAKYIHSVACLRELIKTLRSVPDPESGFRGVDLLKVESLNELEATTRYSVLARKYWSYVVTTPIACAPLIDVELGGVYGNTVGMLASPWLTLFTYAKVRRGPPSVLWPLGALPGAWPPSFLAQEDVMEGDRDGTAGGQGDSAEPAAAGEQERGAEDELVGFAARVRMQTLALDAEVTYADLDSSLLLINESTSTSPVFVQCVSRTPLLLRRDGSVGEAEGCVSIEVAVPFTAKEDEALSLATSKLRTNCGRAGAALEDPRGVICSCLATLVGALGLQESLGYFSLIVSLRERCHDRCRDAAGGQEPLKSESDERHAESGPRSDEEKSHCYEVSTVSMCQVSLGVPLVEVECCCVMLASLPQLLSGEATERHNAAMQRCAREFAQFLEEHSLLTRESHEQMAVQSTAATGPMTQMHLRNLSGHGGAPLPAAALHFDGDKISAVDASNPLCDLW